MTCLDCRHNVKFLFNLTGKYLEIVHSLNAVLKNSKTVDCCLILLYSLLYIYVNVKLCAMGAGKRKFREGENLQCVYNLEITKLRIFFINSLPPLKSTTEK